MIKAKYKKIKLIKNNVNSQQKTFKVLSIDGGGIRGVYPAYILKRIQDELKIDFAKHFDLIVGTSTGSIIASALAIGIKIDDIVHLYENEGKRIFEKNRPSLWGLWKSQYNHRELKKILSQYFNDTKLKDITKTRLIIPATDISNSTVHVFKSSYSDDFVRDKDIKLSDAVLASCSAPLYFNPHMIDTYLLADGGLWANNPSLIALTEAKTRLNQKLENIKIFSIGTGIGKKYYDPSNHKKKWGLLTGWQHKKLIDTMLNLQSISDSNITKLLIQDNYYRINFETDTALSLDKIDIVGQLKTKADKDFSSEYTRIKTFLEI